MSLTHMAALYLTPLPMLPTYVAYFARIPLASILDSRDVASFSLMPIPYNVACNLSLRLALRHCAPTAVLDHASHSYAHRDADLKPSARSQPLSQQHSFYTCA